MQMRVAVVVLSFVLGCTVANAQQISQPTLPISVTNRTLSVQAGARVASVPDQAILHVGFETQLGDAKQVYADGANTSNGIVAALKAAGIPQADIQSESQSLDHDWAKPHKFKLTERWTVRAPAGRAAEILDVAINAGATSSGEIDWALKDRKALDEKALEAAMARVHENARALAKGMGVKLGPLVYVSNEAPMQENAVPVMRDRSMVMALKTAPPLAIEPQKISSEATVYAVFAIE